MKKLTPASSHMWFWYTLIGIAFVVGGGLGYGVHSSSPEGSSTPRTFAEIRENSADTHFTNPLLECAELPEPISIGQRHELQEKVEKLLETAQGAGTITTASVYFRDLNNGPWFGIHEEETFYPASLLKVPLAMWYYWKADQDPSILEQEITFTGPPGISIVHYPPHKQLSAGTTYTIDTLIQYMLQESDNDAAVILAQYAGADQTVEVYKDLGVDPKQQSTQQPINVHTYASFFRILYNATYLRRSLSEHILAIMNESSFREGLVAGVPEGVQVAHKFGEKVLDESQELYQLHDCGIVYAASPYVLCVMTQGHNYEDMAAFVKDTSRTVYENITK